MTRSHAVLVSTLSQAGEEICLLFSVCYSGTENDCESDCLTYSTCGDLSKGIWSLIFYPIFLKERKAVHHWQ